MIASRSNESWSWRFVGGRSINLLVSYPTYARPVSSLHARAYLFIREKQECPRTGTTGEAMGFTSRRFYLRKFLGYIYQFRCHTFNAWAAPAAWHPPLFLSLRSVTIFPLLMCGPFFRIVWQVSSLSFRSHARLILFVGRVGGEFDQGLNC